MVACQAVIACESLKKTMNKWHQATSMGQQPHFPMRPPADESLPELHGLHGPKTNFFPSMRRILESLEEATMLCRVKRLYLGLIVSLLFAGTIGLGLSIAVQTPLLSVMDFSVLGTFIAPLTEEPFKALGMLIVAYILWKAVPSRRYGAALGASAGFGFGIVESIFYIVQIAGSRELAPIAGELIALRIFLTPLMHPLWSALVGIGVFTLVSSRVTQPSVSRAAGWVPFLFVGIGMLNHMVWNGLSLFLIGFGYLGVVLNILLVFPVFALLLRDFLGGHFNFQNFFQTATLAPAPFPVPPPPPPP